MAAITIVGAGHVGITYAVGFASQEHRVHVIDTSQSRLAQLRAGRLWFYEPELGKYLSAALRRRRIKFTSSYARGLAGADFVFVCVPTPSTPEGALDDSALRMAFGSIKRHANVKRPIVVIKSTVPIGTGDAAQTIFGDTAIPVVANPEFLAEGTAVRDFFHPHRIVVGSMDRRAAQAVARLYRKTRAPVVITDSVTAELAKLTANAFLATRVSFINAVAHVCGNLGADVDTLARVLELDPRIGRGYLHAGLGFGGSCLPKDTAAVEHLARRAGAPSDIFAAVSAVNRGQRTAVIDFLLTKWGTLAGRRVALLGLAFKAGTDDTRDSPATALASELVAQRADVRFFDPVVRAPIKGARRATSMRAAIRGSDAIVIATDWDEFRNIDLDWARRVMSGNLLVDGRGLYDPRQVRKAGFEFSGLGRDRQD